MARLSCLGDLGRWGETGMLPTAAARLTAYNRCYTKRHAHALA